jgi:uncharacterized membrane protein
MTFLASSEGRVFSLGLVALLGYIALIALLYLFSQKIATDMIAMSVINVLFGRAAGISYGFTVDFGTLAIIIANIAVESILVLLIYPLFVLSWKSQSESGFFHKMTQNVKAQQLKYKDMFDKYGKYGLFAFVWFPFWMSGPVVGAIIGYLIGIRTLTNIVIVLSGTSLAIVIWTYFLKELMALLESFSAFAPYILLGLFIVIAVILKLVKKP